MKLLIFVGMTIGGIIGGWLGSVLDGGSSFGVWGVILSTIGAFIGIWAGFKAASNWLG